MIPMNDEFDFGQFHREPMPLPSMDLISVLIEDIRSQEVGNVAPESEFTNWTFILPSTYKTVDAGGIDNKDMIFFFTDHISHAAYGSLSPLIHSR